MKGQASENRVHSYPGHEWTFEDMRVYIKKNERLASENNYTNHMFGKKRKQIVINQNWTRKIHAQKSFNAIFCSYFSTLCLSTLQDTEKMVGLSKHSPGSSFPAAPSSL